jgi:hypothetical protein
VKYSFCVLDVTSFFAKLAAKHRLKNQSSAYVLNADNFFNAHPSSTSSSSSTSIEVECRPTSPTHPTGISSVVTPSSLGCCSSSTSMMSASSSSSLGDSSISPLPPPCQNYYGYTYWIQLAQNIQDLEQKPTTLELLTDKGVWEALEVQVEPNSEELRWKGPKTVKHAGKEYQVQEELDLTGLDIVPAIIVDKESKYEKGKKEPAPKRNITRIKNGVHKPPRGGLKVWSVANQKLQETYKEREELARQGKLKLEDIKEYHPPPPIPLATSTIPLEAKDIRDAISVGCPDYEIVSLEVNINEERYNQFEALSQVYFQRLFKTEKLKDIGLRILYYPSDKEGSRLICAQG